MKLPSYLMDKMKNYEIVHVTICYGFINQEMVMNDKNIEMMKKLIEEKKQKGNNSKSNRKADKVIGRASKVMGREASKGVKVGNGGGLFDK